jgi:Ni/Co efflux regulator RcnB
MKSRWLTAIYTLAVLTLIGAASPIGAAPPVQGYGQNTNDQNRQSQNRSGQNQSNHNQFDDHDKQVTRNWYNQNRSHAPAGLRDQDKLSPAEEQRLRPGSELDPNLQRKAHPVPRELARQLPPPPRDSRYVAVGGHVAQVDKRNHVQDVIHLELNF